MFGTVEDFFDFDPDPTIQPGDIYINLPTFGLLPVRHCPGIIVTPACDLENCKTNSVTYLPIIEVSDYIQTKDFIRRNFETLRNCLVAAKIPSDWIKSDFSVNLISKVEDSRRELLRIERDTPREILEKCRAALDILDGAYKQKIDIDGTTRLNLVLSAKQRKSIFEQLRDNNLGNDTFFLPKSDLHQDSNAVRKSSVVMFRYPITLPVEVFELADNVGVSDWNTGLLKGQVSEGHLDEIAVHRPLKTQKLAFRHFSDLLSRYLSLYLRFGVPNLGQRSRDGLVTEMMRGI